MNFTLISQQLFILTSTMIVSKMNGIHIRNN